MSDFYRKKENLISVLTHYMAIFSEGNEPIVPIIRVGGDGPINVRATFDSACFAGFPESEKQIWLNYLEIPLPPNSDPPKE